MTTRIVGTTMIITHDEWIKSGLLVVVSDANNRIFLEASGLDSWTSFVPVDYS